MISQWNFVTYLCCMHCTGIPSTVIQYKFSIIRTATENFSKDHLIGCGGFGAVYHGYISNTLVAIKKLYKVNCLLNVSDMKFLVDISHNNSNA
jgi:hypothetical protein